MPTPRLSVVVPTHNRSGDLPRAVRSVLAQSYRDLEVIVVDDGSRDETSEVVGRLIDEDARVRCLRNDVPCGPASARNRGISVAEGDLLAFCDDDDAWLPDAAEVLVTFSDGHPDTGVVSSWHEVLLEWNGRTSIYRGPLEFGHRQLLWANFVALPLGVINRRLFPDGVWFDEGMPPSEDWELWLRCSETRPVAMVPRVLYLYRQHAAGRLTRTGTNRARGRRALVAKHGASMTAACRLYHEAVTELTEHGRLAMSRRLTTAASSAPGDAAFVSFLMAVGKQAGALGRRTFDPGLPARTLSRLIAAS